jgi:glycosyltransferase involved in cell wall biosynthesis
VIVSVGFLVERKGHDLLLRAVAALPPAERPFVVIAGDGPEEGRLRALIATLKLESSVRLLGAVAHEDLPGVYSAADLSVLASTREGWPNVLLESMACGTPAVATAVHGSPEVLAEPGVGRLVPERSVDALRDAIRAALTTPFDRSHVRRYAERMSWRETTAGLDEVFRAVVREAEGRAVVGTPA